MPEDVFSFSSVVFNKKENIFHNSMKVKQVSNLTVIQSLDNLILQLIQQTIVQFVDYKMYE